MAAPSRNLVFLQPHLSGSPTALVFGEDIAVATPAVTVDIYAVLAGVVEVAALVAVPVIVDALVLLCSTVTVTAAVFYDNRVTRHLDSRATSPFQTAIPSVDALDSAWGVSLPQKLTQDMGWETASHADAALGIPYYIAASVRRSKHAVWQLAVQSVAQAEVVHQTGVFHADSVQGCYEKADQLHQQSASVLQTGVFKVRHHADIWQWAQAKVHNLSGRSGASRHLRGVTQISFPWQVAGQAKNGKSRWPLPQPEGPTVYPRDGHLVFECPPLSGFPLHLVFGAQACYLPPVNSGTVVVPILRTYVTINSISLRRVDTGVELHAHGFNMTLDYQSWTWTWSASLHHDAEGHLGRDSNGDFAELEAVVNGIPFRLRLERTVCDRRFNPTRWAVSGRGKASVLSGPVMSFGNTVDRTAQQLMADALTVNGASLGWAVDWGLTDWLVPAGAWSLRGSYIDAVNDIATAAGGYVQPHPTDATLRILPRYPIAPWNWGSVAPDFEIPDHAAEVEGTEYIDKPGYNKVFVGGVGAGVFGPFKRAGTAGNILAPQVTHALITHADAHRQRGLAELSDTGSQEHITLRMQVLEETGIIMPGQFVRYVGKKPVVGIVRSTSIDWSRPVLRQTIGIETHA